MRASLGLTKGKTLLSLILMIYFKQSTISFLVFLVQSSKSKKSGYICFSS